MSMILLRRMAAVLACLWLIPSCVDHRSADVTPIQSPFRVGVVGKAPADYDGFFEPSILAAQLFSYISWNPTASNGAWQESKYDAAEKMTCSEEKKRCHVILNRKVRFHDGSSVTSKDIAFTLDYLRRTHSNMLERVKIEINDDFDFEIYGGNYIELEAIFHAPILQAGAAIGGHVDFVNARPMGSGPYEFVSFNAIERSFSLKKSSQAFYKHSGGPDELEVKYFASYDLAFNAILEGELDFFMGLNPRDAHFLGRDDRFHVFQHSPPYIYFVIFANEQFPFEDWRVRKALSLMLDRQKMLESSGLHDSLRPYSEPFLPESNLEKPLEKGNLYEAVQLLKEAGWVDSSGGWRKNGLKLSFDLIVSTIYEQYVPLLKKLAQSLAEAGVEARLVVEDSESFQARMEERKFLALFGNFQSESILRSLSTLYSSKKKTIFETRFSDPLTDECAHVLVGNPASSCIEEVRTILLQRQPAIPLYRPLHYGVTSGVEGRYTVGVQYDPYDLFALARKGVLK